MRVLVSRTIAPFTRTRPASTSRSPSLREHRPSLDKPRATLTVPGAGRLTGPGPLRLLAARALHLALIVRDVDREREEERVLHGRVWLGPAFRVVPQDSVE